MPVIRKPIVSEGVYRLADGNLAVIPSARINHWASEGMRFLNAGNKIPLPWSHIDPATKKPVVMGPHLERSDINGGFWTSLISEYVHDINPVTGQPYGQTLIGYADVPGDPLDPNTPAGKLGTTVKETSIYAKDFVDGRNQAFHDVPLHVAAVTHAIQPGQPNFSIAMSQYVSPVSMAAAPPPTAPPAGGTPKAEVPPKDESDTNDGQNKPGLNQPSAGGASVQQVIESLRTCGIALPPDTNDANFLERLMVALGQKAISDGGDSNPDGTLNQPPEGASIKQPAPVAMSNVAITPENFASLITKEVFMSHPAAKAMDDTNKMLLDMLGQSAKATRRAKLDALVAARPDLAEYAKTNLEPLLELTMSFLPGAPKPEFDIAFAAVSALPQPAPRQSNATRAALLMNSGLAMSQDPHTVNNPFMVTQDEGLDTDKVVDQFFANTGG